MRSALLSAAAALLLAMSATAAAADPSANQILGRTPTELSSDERVAWTMGVIQGFGWSNAQLNFDKKPQLYCQPDKLALGPTETLSILEGYVNKHAESGEEHAGLMLLLALIELYPCPRTQDL